MKSQRRVTPTERAAWVLSLMVHLGVAALVWWQPAALPPSQPEPVPVELVTIPEPKPIPPPPPLPPPDPPPPAPEPGRPAPPPLQLEPGRLAEIGRAATPGKPTASPDGVKAVVVRELDAGATRTARDVLVAQILRFWRDRPALGPEAVLSVRVVVRADGTLGPPFGRDQPWNPAAVIDGYDRAGPADPNRRALESFYLAMRMAQPLTLPPELRKRAPFAVALDFRLGDAR